MKDPYPRQQYGRKCGHFRVTGAKLISLMYGANTVSDVIRPVLPTPAHGRTVCRPHAYACRCRNLSDGPGLGATAGYDRCECPGSCARRPLDNPRTYID